ncbi:MAG: hypothetical protein ACRERZ_01995 [Gammaproteobacteria bacterium]
METACFIALEHEIDGLDTMIDGKRLAQTADILDAVASELGVRPISRFISIDPEQSAEFMEGEGASVGGIELLPLQQFSAQDGLTT